MVVTVGDDLGDDPRRSTRRRRRVNPAGEVGGDERGKEELFHAATRSLEVVIASRSVGRRAEAPAMTLN